MSARPSVAALRFAAALVAVAALAAPAAADRPSLDDAIAAGKAWVASPDAAQSRRPLAYQLDYGRHLGDARQVAACKKKLGARGTARTASRLALVLSCAELGAALLRADGTVWEAVDLDDLPSAFDDRRKQLAGLARTHTLVVAHRSTGAGTGSGTMATAILAIRTDGKGARIGAVLIDAAIWME